MNLNEEDMHDEHLYEDRTLFIDDEGVTVTSYYWPRHHRHIPFASIVSVETIAIGTWSGRYRLVGLEFRHLHKFFHWDTRRSKKSEAIVLDIGRRLRPTLTPDDHERVLQLILDHTGDADED